MDPRDAGEERNERAAREELHRDGHELVEEVREEVHLVHAAQDDQGPLVGAADERPARVGRMTNLDKLVMEIWTDGTIDSLEALKESARILVSYFAQLYEPKTKEKDEVAKVIPSVSDDVLKMRIE